MIQSQIFRKYFLLAVSIIMIFVFLGFYANRLIFDYMRNQFNQTEKSQEPMAPVFMAKILDRINPNDKLAGLIELESWHQDKNRGGFDLYLFDEQGVVLYPQQKPSPVPANTKWPLSTYAYIQLELGEMGRPPMPPLGMPAPPPPPGMREPPPGPPPPFGPRKITLIKLDGHPARYLGVVPTMGRPFSQPGRPQLSEWIFWIGPTSMVLSLLLGVGVTLALIYSSVQKQIVIADGVINALRNGNLKARFPVVRKDEFGQAMNRFNLMADEIEKLVEHLQEVEKARNKLLQELAHDLRTPLTSLRSMIETLISREKDLSSETKLDLLKSSATEILYFSRLVDDLLFLAQISDPHYKKTNTQVNLKELIEQLQESYKHKYPNKSIVLDLPTLSPPISGDLKMLERLLRNAFDNSLSFANAQVKISLVPTGTSLNLIFNDDGNGFSHEALTHFGIKKASRIIDPHTEGRISVGLGSVIMKSITEIHHGRLEVRNIGDDGAIKGAQLSIMLPLS